MGTEDLMGIVSQVVSLMTTVLAAAWWLSQRLTKLATTLESHTQIVNQRMKMLERELCSLKNVVEASRQEIHSLRERAVRLEAKTEG